MDSVAGAGEQRSECFSGIIEKLGTGDSVGKSINCHGRQLSQHGRGGDGQDGFFVATVCRNIQVKLFI